MSTLRMRLVAPMASFGTPAVGDLIPTARMPTLSAVVGLFANALGHDHVDTRTDELQNAISMAARCDREGSLYEDFQIANLNGPTMVMGKSPITTAHLWTEERGGDRGGDKSNLIVRKEYLVGWAYVVAIETTAQWADALVSALVTPARPLYVGRRNCPMSRPPLIDVVDQPLLQALRTAPWQGFQRDPHIVAATWPDTHHDHGFTVQRTVTAWDLRTWSCGVHQGCRRVVEGTVAVA